MFNAGGPGRYCRWIQLLWCAGLFLSAAAETHRDSNEKDGKLVVASTLQGRVVGQSVPEGGIFWGIPYSQPPVGKYRWKKPRKPVAYTTKYWNATFAKPGCPQRCHSKHAKYSCPLVTSEDCLYLNIWVPMHLLKKSTSNSTIEKPHYRVAKKYTKEDSKSLAVMFFLHGGNFVIGAGSAALYDSRFIAHRGRVVVVTTNYRLGALGFLVQGSGPDAAVGNYGMLDQIMALKWVKKNIRYFGGNPRRITVFGQSAGAESIGILMTSPKAKGLFHGAIFESDPLALPFRKMKSAENFGAKFARKAGCKPGNMTCLRNLAVSMIVKVSMNSASLLTLSSGKALFAFQPWSPVVDGSILLEQPLDAFRKGNFHRMPIIMGTNRNDAYLFIDVAFKGRISFLMYNLIIQIIGKSHASAMLNEYPAKFGNNKMTLSRMATDFVFVCPAREVLFSTGMNSWSYIFNATMPFKGLFESSYCDTGVCHGAELAFVFDTARLTKYHFTKSQNNLSQKIEFYWTNFAKYGNPNGKVNAQHHGVQAEYWGRFRDWKKRGYRALEMTTHGNIMITNPDKGKCNFWDKLNVYGKL